MRSMRDEIWKDVLGYEGLYQISTLGRVKGLSVSRMGNGGLKLRKERILKVSNSTEDYRVALRKQPNVVKMHLLHRLIAEAFIDNPSNFPVVNHKDGNKLNNNLTNLEWCTHSYNQKHAIDVLGKPTPRGEAQGLSKLTDLLVVEIRESSLNQTELSRKYGVCRKTIDAVQKGKTWKHV